jgi:hypothetical protein
MTTIRPAFAPENKKYALLAETSPPLDNLTYGCLKRPIVTLLL